jgi:aryl-alcohol dehydrogenase-like predicted oxidoreductase
MRVRQLGNTGLVVSEVGFGCARIGGVLHNSSRSEIVGLLRRATAAGITFFDTADMYAQGESERLVGEALQGLRDQVIIASKFGYQLARETRVVRRVKPLLKPIVRRLGLISPPAYARIRGGVGPQDFSPQYIAHAVEASLRRLRTDYIDLYQLHDPSVEVLKCGEFVGVLERLRDQGKIRYWGVAAQRPEDAVAGLRHPSLASVQVGFSALEQAALDVAIPEAASRGVAVVARQVYASGLLTRQVDEVVVKTLDTDPEVAARKHDQLRSYAQIVNRSGRSPVELALQFALARTDVSVALLGISRPEQLAESLAALKAPRLSHEEMQLVTAARRAGR